MCVVSNCKSRHKSCHDGAFSGPPTLRPLLLLVLLLHRRLQLLRLRRLRGLRGLQLLQLQLQSPFDR